MPQPPADLEQRHAQIPPSNRDIDNGVATNRKTPLHQRCQCVAERIMNKSQHLTYGSAPAAHPASEAARLVDAVLTPLLPLINARFPLLGALFPPLHAASPAPSNASSAC